MRMKVAYAIAVLLAVTCVRILVPETPLGAGIVFGVLFLFMEAFSGVRWLNVLVGVTNVTALRYFVGSYRAGTIGTAGWLLLGVLIVANAALGMWFWSRRPRSFESHA